MRRGSRGERYARVPVVVYVSGGRARRLVLEEVLPEYGWIVYRDLLMLAEFCEGDRELFYCPICGTRACIHASMEGRALDFHHREHVKMGREPMV